jgi:hypothetical protein
VFNFLYLFVISFHYPSDVEKISRQVIEGSRLELHRRIPEPTQKLINLTMVEADHRPTFTNLKEDLRHIELKDGK